MALTASGLGSNLDVNGIVSQLMSVERKPLSALQVKESGVQAKISAYGSIKASLGNLQSALTTLNNPASFQAFKATPSDPTAISTTATSGAAKGAYTVSVSQLAQAQSLVANGQASQTSAIGTGAPTTLTFDFGTTGVGSFTSNGSGAKSVVIDASNNSLQGIRDAINAANIGVTASIVNDGSANPYRLTLSSNNSGASNSMSIAAAGDAAVMALMAYNPAGVKNMTETQVAQDAKLTINGVAVTKSSNTVADAIPGVTMSLQKTTATPSVITVDKDMTTIQKNVEGFVKAYNDLNTMLRNVSSYNETTKQSATLNGDSTVRSIQTQMRSILSTPVAGAGAISTLSQIGVSFQRDGSLSLDVAQLNKITNPQDIATLFSATGKTTDSLVKYSSALSTATPGTYAISVSQLATKGGATGSAAAGLTVTAGVNDALNLSVDGKALAVTLAAGTYTATGLAAELQSKINGAVSGASVTVGQAAGVLSVTSDRYGSASSVTITGGNAATSLFGTPTQVAGVDVAGTINGVAANGFGQNLTSAAGNPSSSISVDIIGGAVGARGSITYSQGFAHQLGKLADTLLGDTGSIKSKTDGLSNSMKDIATQRDNLNVRLTAVEKRYRAQFASLDALVGGMNQTSQFLQRQLAKI